MNLGEIIKEYREKNNLSQDIIAERSGFSKAYISVLERNVNPKSGLPPIPSIKAIKAIARAINSDFSTVFNALDDNLKASLAESIPKDDIIAKIPGAFPLNPTHKIPLLGQISAGLPLYAEENVEGYLWTDLNHGAEYFGLRVKGDSMNAANIKDGDVIIVRKQDIVDDNDIAVVLVDNENATVKRYHRTGDIVILTPQSTNPLHHLQQYDLKNHSVRILGRVMECRSKY